MDFKVNDLVVVDHCKTLGIIRGSIIGQDVNVLLLDINCKQVMRISDIEMFDASNGSHLQMYKNHELTALKKIKNIKEQAQTVARLVQESRARIVNYTVGQFVIFHEVLCTVSNINADSIELDVVLTNHGHKIYPIHYGHLIGGHDDVIDHMTKEINKCDTQIDSKSQVLTDICADRTVLRNIRTLALNRENT